MTYHLTQQSMAQDNIDGQKALATNAVNVIDGADQIAPGSSRASSRVPSPIQNTTTFEAISPDDVKIPKVIRRVKSRTNIRTSTPEGADARNIKDPEVAEVRQNSVNIEPQSNPDVDVENTGTENLGAPEQPKLVQPATTQPNGRPHARIATRSPINPARTMQDATQTAGQPIQVTEIPYQIQISDKEREQTEQHIAALKEALQHLNNDALGSANAFYQAMKNAYNKVMSKIGVNEKYLTHQEALEIDKPEVYAAAIRQGISSWFHNVPIMGLLTSTVGGILGGLTMTVVNTAMTLKDSIAWLLK